MTTHRSLRATITRFTLGGAVALAVWTTVASPIGAAAIGDTTERMPDPESTALTAGQLIAQPQSITELERVTAPVDSSRIAIGDVEDMPGVVNQDRSSPLVLAGFNPQPDPPGGVFAPLAAR